MKRRLLLVGVIVGMALQGAVPSIAAAMKGEAQVVDPATRAPRRSGGSATPFALGLPTNAGCGGDSADDGYRVQSYMVPAAVDPGALRFGSAGPAPSATGSAFRQPLYATTSSPFVNEQTANVDEKGDIAIIVNLPVFDLAVFGPGQVPAQSYNVGIACTKGTGDAVVVERFWNAVFAIEASAQDTAAGISWRVAGGPAETGAVSDDSAAAKVGDRASSEESGVATGGTSTVDGESAATTPARPLATPGDAGSKSTNAPTGAPPSFGVPVISLVGSLGPAGVGIAAALLGFCIVAMANRRAALRRHDSALIPVEAG